MPQIILKPSDPVKQGAEWKPRRGIPASVRTFAKYPNVDDWLPGDLLLTSQHSMDFVHKKISQALADLGYAGEDARWQHAAVYMGEGFVTEATTKGVEYNPIFSYLRKHLLRVRRDASLSSDERWRIAIQAGVRLASKYDFENILKIWKQSKKEWKNPPASLPRLERSVICSELYAQAYASVTERLVVSLENGAVTPAALSCSPRLQDVPLHWRGLASN